MNSKFGGVWIDLSELDTDRIHHIVENGSGVFTIAIPSHLLNGVSSSLALVSGDSNFVTHLAVITAGKRVSDLERKIQVGPLLRFNERIDRGVLLNSIPKRVQQYAIPPEQRFATVPLATWVSLLETAIDLGGLSTDDYMHLFGVTDSRSEENQDALPEPVGLERDAFATAFEVFGGSIARKAYIGSSAPIPDAPFIAGLRHRDIYMIEDTMINHDAISFPGITALQPHIVGAIGLSTPSGTLTVLNANRTKIERTLGVDLVYYNHYYDSFTLVQYKRMTGDNDPVYRPKNDKNLEKELQRMRKFEHNSTSAEATYETYRLLENPFFLKLCKAHTPGDWNGRMLQGMYFPLQLWDLLVEAPTARGPRNGIAIGFDTAKRRFTNSQFTNLLSEGWLGTVGANTQLITDILEEKLTAGRSIIAASHEPSSTAIDYARDGRGRFASFTDETAV